jgi:hypothetical protein
VSLRQFVKQHSSMSLLLQHVPPSQQLTVHSPFFEPI